MVFIGLIYRFDTTQGSGFIMLSDGEKKEFTTNEWVDTLNEPAIGQKIVYEISGNTARIRVATEADELNAASNKEVQENGSAQTPLEGFNSADEYVDHFVEMGFKRLKDTENDGVRTITLRRFADGEAQEVIIQDGSTISVKKTINGQPV